MRSLSLRPNVSLTSLKACFVDGLQTFGFPPPCHPSYRARDFYTLEGLTPSEHTSFPWTHNRTGGFPAHGFLMPFTIRHTPISIPLWSALCKDHIVHTTCCLCIA
ncbi:MAG: hypothetical protein QY310_03930 [Candidatus Jettenia sp. CY-1]|nr:MAG: hypothetical protein QY310_03930 [Candidatus Jettenia sp. CY-1]